MGNLHFHDAKSYLENGLKAIEEDRMEDALVELQQSVALDDGNSQALNMLGMVASMLGELEVAEDALLRALEIDPNDLMALMGMASVLAFDGEVEEVIEYLQRAEAIAPDNLDVLVTAASAYLDLNEVELAQEATDKALKLAPKDGRVKMLQGRVFFAQEELELALPPFREAVRLMPNDPDARFMLGTIFGALGRSTEADAEFRRALMLDPDLITAYVSRASVLYELGRKNESQSLVDEALAKGGDDPVIQHLVGNFYYMTERLPEALDHLKKAVALDPEYIEAYDVMLEIAQQLGDEETAKQAHLALVQLDPEYVEDIIAQLMPLMEPQGNTKKASKAKTAPVTATGDIYQLKITLKGFRPPIWRRVLVPGKFTLEKLHQVIQISMGWEDGHMHDFEIDGVSYGVPDGDDAIFGIRKKSEKRAVLRDVAPYEKMKFTYVYDFGDDWRHEILVEKTLPTEPGKQYPVCLKGVGAGPPEDVGGVWGYSDFLEAIEDPNNEQHEEMLEWVGGEFDPNAFDLDAVNERLKRVK